MKIGKKIEIETLNLKFLIEKLDIAEKQLQDGSDDLHFRLSYFRKRVSKKDIEKYDDYFFGTKQIESERKADQNQGIVPTKDIELLSIPREKKDTWLKKIYRKIVSSTHPDKFQNFPVISLKQKYLNIYRKTVNAWKSSEDDVILVAAYDTDIKVDHPDALTILQNGNKKKNSRLQEIQKLLAYQWYHVPLKDREQTLEKYLKNLGYEFCAQEIKNVVNLPRKRKVGTRPKSLKERKNVK